VIRRLLLTLALLGAVAAGCGDDDDTAAAPDDPVDEVTTTAAGDDTTTSAGEEPAGDGATVTAVDFAFDPGTVEVAAGSTVTWTNEDGVAHTATSGEPGTPDGTFAESLDPGASAEVTFEEPGTFPYFCAIHPSMVGEVVVS
jgi:manganese oxidase